MENLVSFITLRKNQLITLIFILLVSAILLKNMTPSSAQYLKTGVLIEKNFTTSK